MGQNDSCKLLNWKCRVFQTRMQLIKEIIFLARGVVELILALCCKRVWGKELLYFLSINWIIPVLIQHFQHSKCFLFIILLSFIQHP